MAARTQSSSDARGGNNSSITTSTTFAAYCLLKSRPTANFTYDEILNAYTNDIPLDFGSPSTVVVLPTHSGGENEPATALNKLREVLRDEAVAVDKLTREDDDENDEGRKNCVWVLPFDSLSVLKSLSRLGFTASECTVDHDGVHTWTLRCCSLSGDESHANSGEITGARNENVAISKNNMQPWRSHPRSAASSTLSSQRVKPATNKRTRRQNVYGSDVDSESEYQPSSRRKVNGNSTASKSSSEQTSTVVSNADQIPNVDDAAYTIQSLLSTTNANATALDVETSTRACMYCSKSFRTLFEIVRHIRSHTGEKPFACRVCGQTMTQKASIAKHIKTAHKTVAQNGAHVYICPHCPTSDAGEDEIENSARIFTDATNLLHHIRYEHDQNNMFYKCFTCEATASPFSSIEAIGLHYNTVHATKLMLEETSKDQSASMPSTPLQSPPPNDVEILFNGSHDDATYVNFIPQQREYNNSMHDYNAGEEESESPVIDSGEATTVKMEPTSNDDHDIVTFDVTPVDGGGALS